MNQKMLRFLTSIKIVIINALNDSNSNPLDRFCSTVIDFKFFAPNTSYINTRSSEIHFTARVDTLNRISN